MYSGTPSRHDVLFAAVAFFALLLTLNAPEPDSSDTTSFVSGILLALAGIWFTLARLRFRLPQDAQGWLTWLVFGYAAWLAISALSSSWPFGSWIYFFVLGALPLGYAFGLLALKTTSAWRLTLTGLLGLGLLIGAWGCWEYLVQHKRPNGPLIDWNSYAALMNLMILPLATLWLSPAWTRSPMQRRLLWLGIFLFSTFMFMAFSRGASLALAASLPLIVWFHWRQPGTARRTITLLLTLALSYALIALSPIKVREHNLNALLASPDATINADASIQSRLQMWESTLQMWQAEGEVTGKGLATWGMVYPAYRSPEEMSSSGDMAHNDYLQFLFEGGPVLLALLIALGPITALVLLWQLRKAAEPRMEQVLAAGLAIALWSLALQAGVNFIYYNVSISLLAGLYLAYAWRTLRQSGTPALQENDSEAAASRPSLAPVAGHLAAFAMTYWLLSSLICWVMFGPHERPWAQQMSMGQALRAGELALVLAPLNPYPATMVTDLYMLAAQSTSDNALQARLLKNAYMTASRWLENSPEEPGALTSIGQILALQPDLDRERSSADYLRSALTTNPGFLPARNALMARYRVEGDTSAAHALLNEGLTWAFLAKDLNPLEEFAQQGIEICGELGLLDEQAAWLARKALVEAARPD